MGARNVAIDGDDVYHDIAGDFERHLKQTQSVEQATAATRESMAEWFDDEDDREAAWLALADVQWTYGALSDEVRDAIAADGFGMDRWSDADVSTRRERRHALDAFFAKIAEPNPKPKPIPKVVRRPPHFQPGDCLAMSHEDGRYTAGLVTATCADDIEYGRDLVVLLDWVDESRPTLEDFAERSFLTTPRGELTAVWMSSKSFRKMATTIERVGSIEVTPSDPRDTPKHADWPLMAGSPRAIAAKKAENAKAGSGE